MIDASFDDFNEKVDRTSSKTKCAYLVKFSKEINEEIEHIHSISNFTFLSFKPFYYIPQLEKIFIYVTWVLILILNVITTLSFNTIR
jgi:hypothetical protein